MADFVFRYTDYHKQMPNIHGHINNFTAKIQDRQRDFSKIKSRYLEAMRKQIKGTKNNQTGKIIKDAYEIAEFNENFQLQIEQAFTNQYNELMERIDKQSGSEDTIIKQFQQLSNELKNSKDQKEAKEVVDNFIEAFVNNFKALGLIERSSGKFKSTIRELLEIEKLQQSVERAIKEGKQISAQTLASNLTKPTEAAVAIFASLVLEQDKKAFGKVKEALQGAFGQQVTYKIIEGDSEVELQAFDKAVDVKLMGQKVNVMIKAKGKDTISYEIEVDPLVSAKAYLSETDTISLIQTSGENSQVVRTLKSIYGSDEKNEYIIYNTFAFNSYKKENTAANWNYRIFRSDLISLLAERYIAGFGSESGNMTSIFISNYKAYPVLSIIAAIADQAVEVEKEGKRQYGSTKQGDIFSIYIANAESINNKYLGKNPNNFLKAYRIKKVKEKIDGLMSQGKINMKNFENYMQRDAIDLKELYPGIFVPPLTD